MYKYSFAFLLCVLLLGSSLAQAQNRPEALVSSQDIIKAVSQANGKVVVVNFWASWCGPCRAEIPDLIALRNRVPENKLLIIGVSLDQDPAEFSRFAGKAGFNYPIYRAKADVPQAFSIRGIPRTVVYSPKGELALTKEGFVTGAELEKVINKLLGS